MNKLKYLYFIVLFLVLPFFVFAQSRSVYNANDLLAKSDIFITPRTGNFTVGQTFEAKVYVDTKGSSINAINLRVNYDPTKLEIVSSSGGQSVFGIWVDTPFYDNDIGVAGMSGVITGGLKANSGLIVTITFKVLSPGQTSVSVGNQTTANLNDGYGSEVLLNRGLARYVLNSRPPEAVLIYSQTHPIDTKWSNNNNPAFTWESADPSSGYSVLFDNLFNSIPLEVITNEQAFSSYENVKDGLSYLHVRSVNNGVWGDTSSYLVRIDTKPPAKFKPTVSKVNNSGEGEKYLISFFTTDSTSGLDHFEIGVAQNNMDVSLINFMQTESPYLLDLESGKNTRVFIRAYDTAGNVQEEYVDIYPGVVLVQVLKKIGTYILLITAPLLLIGLVLHYFFGHYVLGRLKKLLKR